MRWYYTFGISLKKIEDSFVKQPIPIFETLRSHIQYTLLNALGTKIKIIIITK